MVTIVVLCLFFLPMIGEAILSSRHERVLRAQGAVEPNDDVIGWMQFAYPGGFLGMVVEAGLRDAPLDAIFVWGAAIFAAGKAIKYWAIATLGSRWTFRVLVPRHLVLITTGPYAFMRHPNYLGLVGELVGGTVMAHAWIAGPIATIVFGVLIVARIRVEERAMGLESRR